jgi:hypothetical protein
MAQGTVKRIKPSTVKTGKKKQISKTPQKSKATKKILRKFTSGLAAKTEAMLGERAGHLELIGKGKKTDKADRINVKGGSRKFG